MLGRQGSCEAVISEIAVDFKIFDCMNPEPLSEGGMLVNCRQNHIFLLIRKGMCTLGTYKSHRLLLLL